MCPISDIRSLSPFLPSKELREQNASDCRSRHVQLLPDIPHGGQVRGSRPHSRSPTSRNVVMVERPFKCVLPCATGTLAHSLDGYSGKWKGLCLESSISRTGLRSTRLHAPDSSVGSMLEIMGHDGLASCQVRRATCLLQMAGFTQNLDVKSCLIPTLCLRHLGFLLSTEMLAFGVPLNKIAA